MTTIRPPSCLQIELLSDTTFGRGEGTPGIVDTEVEHDEFGLPFISGRTVRGLLRDSWLSFGNHFPDLCDASARVLGASRIISEHVKGGDLHGEGGGRTLEAGQFTHEHCLLRVGDARLPNLIRRAVRSALDRKDSYLVPEVVLGGFTDIRHQTAQKRVTGASADGTLRATRVVLRGFVFESELTWLDGYQPAVDDLRVLAMCALATRHGGALRNRGLGHLRLTLDGNLASTRRYASTAAREGHSQ